MVDLSFLQMGTAAVGIVLALTVYTALVLRPILSKYAA